MLQRSPTEALSHWFVYVVLWEVGGAVLCGALLGYVAGRLLKLAERKKQSSVLLFSLTA